MDNDTCPVCGMTIDVDAPGATLVADGQTINFCSEGCKEAFAANPGAYAGPDRN